jgi:erythromycin esterase-like protein
LWTCYLSFLIVLIGEASHGTKEFYEYRCELTKQLIQGGQCKAVCIEGDFPDVSLLHAYCVHLAPDLTIENAMSGFKRFPTWMWFNSSMKDFVVWLHNHNAALPFEQRTGIVGLGIYSLNTSRHCVINHLAEHDPASAELVKGLYDCFDRVGGCDPQMYGLIASKKIDHLSCKREFAEALQRVADMTRQASQLTTPLLFREFEFINEMNARVVAGAEVYYRSMFDPTSMPTAEASPAAQEASDGKFLSSWELRDSYFYDVVQRVRAHLRSTRAGGADGVCVWAHNSHLGDSRYTTTSAGAAREFNVGQLLKDSVGSSEVISVGQFTYSGTVTAADDWDGEERQKKVRPGLPDSWEELFHVLSEKAEAWEYSLDLRVPEVQQALQGSKKTPFRLERAIGVIYRPQTERLSHYFHAFLANVREIICQLIMLLLLRFFLHSTSSAV